MVLTNKLTTLVPHPGSRLESQPWGRHLSLLPKNFNGFPILNETHPPRPIPHELRITTRILDRRRYSTRHAPPRFAPFTRATRPKIGMQPPISLTQPDKLPPTFGPGKTTVASMGQILRKQETLSIHGSGEQLISESIFL